MTVYNLEIVGLVDKVTLETSKREHYDILQEALFTALDEIAKKEKKNEN